MAGSWQIRELAPADRDWVEPLLAEAWGAALVVVHGETIDPVGLPGWVCADGENILGLVTYRISQGACEVITLNSLRENAGIGTALLKAVEETARRNQCEKVWLITTNDNLGALGFYQKRGYVITAVFPNAVNESRQIKPSIPLIGPSGIPIRDEIALTLSLK
jgi:ribosomal protein S18 acetylase RimI-like enzyme